MLCQLNYLPRPLPSFYPHLFCSSLESFRGQISSSVTSDVSKEGVTWSSEHPSFNPAEGFLYQPKLLNRAGCPRAWRQVWSYSLVAECFHVANPQACRASQYQGRKQGCSSIWCYGLLAQTTSFLQAFDGIKSSSHWTQPSLSGPSSDSSGIEVLDSRRRN